jgi:hypothetical protein
MNKKLEEIKKLCQHEGTEDTFDDGFDAAIALDLPVKFALWYNSKEQSWKEWRRTVYWIGEEGVKKAYDYWINNVHKFE